MGCDPEALVSLRRIASLDVPAHVPNGDPDLAQAHRRRLIAAAVDLFDAVTDETPLALLVDDAQWLDEATWTLLSSVLRRDTTRPLLFLAACRDPLPRGVAAVRALDRLQVNRLGPLSPVESRRLLDFFLQRRAIPLAHDAKSALVAASGGNPFYIRELSQQLPSGSLGHPATLSLAVAIQARAMRLTPAALRISQITALLGRHATTSRIERLLGVSRLEFVCGLEEALQQSIIEEVAEGVRVLHDLVGQSIVALLSRASQQYLHNAAADLLLDEAEAGRSPVLLHAAVEHWMEAGLPARAVAASLQFAGYLLSHGLPSEAADLLEKVTPHACSGEQRSVLTTLHVRALRGASRWRDIVRLDTGATDREGRSPAHTSDEFVRLEARWVCDENMRDLLVASLTCLQDTTAPVDHRMEAGTWAIIFAHNTCDERAAGDAWSRLAVLQPLRGGAELTVSRARMIYHTGFGELDFAALAATQLLEQARGSGDTFDLVRTLTQVATAYRVFGSRREAATLLEEAFAIAAKEAFSTRATRVAETRACIALEEADLQAAQFWITRAAQYIGSSHSVIHVHEFAETAARVALASGDVAKALHIIAESRPLRMDDPVPCRLACQLSLRVEAGLLEPQCMPTRQDLTLLLHTCRAGWRFGRFDRGVAYLVLGLARQGDVSLARAIAREYVTIHRREREAPPRELQVALDEVGSVAFAHSSALLSGPVENH
jgi:hypothetical protein